MNPFYVLASISLLLVSSTPTFAQPYSPSCKTAIDKRNKARKDLIPYQRTMELARAREQGAYAELAVCTRGGIYSTNKAVACNEATWRAPERTKDVIEVEGQYHQERSAFEALFEQAQRICLIDL